VVAAALAIAVVGVAIALLASSGSGTVAERAHPNALTTQAQELYAPLLLFDRATTPDQRARTRSAPIMVARRVDACQTPYQRQLVHAAAGTDRHRLYLLLAHGALLESRQSAIAPVGAALRVAASAWADMRLANPTFQRFARGLSMELSAALDRPRFDACAFVRAIAANGYSLAWAVHSSYGRGVRGYWADALAAGEETARFWRYVRTGPIKERHLWTPRQLRDLASVPGEIR
jgi:hypothetical protein